ncbi:High-affinity branched-chain amino acid transport ATP-binding protein LivF, partial [Geodia barretti]
MNVNNIEVIYDHVILVLKGVSLEVPEGRIVTLLGANGAGKTTTLKAISNLLRVERGEVTKGSIEYRGQRIDRLNPSALVRQGIIQRRHAMAGYVSGGEQQMMVIGRALMARPKLILLDEPSMGLAPQLVAEIFDIVARLNREEGVSFLLAEQNATVALRVADYGYVLENGRVVLDGDAETLRTNEDVKEFYLGLGTAGRRSYRDVKHIGAATLACLRSARAAGEDKQMDKTQREAGAAAASFYDALRSGSVSSAALGYGGDFVGQECTLLPREMLIFARRLGSAPERRFWTWAAARAARRAFSPSNSTA